jgi:hypothetical protein
MINYDGYALLLGDPFELMQGSPAILDVPLHAIELRMINAMYHNKSADRKLLYTACGHAERPVTATNPIIGELTTMRLTFLVNKRDSFDQRLVGRKAEKGFAFWKLRFRASQAKRRSVLLVGR